MHEAEPASPRGSRGRSKTHPLLELDPELGQSLSPERALDARRHLTAPVTMIRKGTWTDGQLAELGSGVVGLLILDGLLARQLTIEDTVSTELLGPGDVVRPRPRADGAPELLETVVRWNALSRLRVAVLERHVFERLMNYPEVAMLLLDRLAERAGRLATLQAISQLNRVDRRLLALFRHLAERWGRVAPDGIVVPLALPHRLIGELIGARRPTVSSALAELGREGRLVRRDDGTWLLARPSAEEATPHSYPPGVVVE